MATFVKETLPTIGRSLVYIALCVVLFFIGLVKGMSTLNPICSLRIFAEDVQQNGGVSDGIVRRSSRY
jgi:hypothetical protein